MTTELVTVPGDLGAPVIRRAAGVTIDQIVQAWLDAQRASLRTRRAYADAVASFRAALQAAGHDLDAAPEAVALAAQAWAGQGDAAAATYLQTQPGSGMLLMIRSYRGCHAPEAVYLEPFATRGYVAALQTDR